ncbi:MAG: hypothetical protein J6M54_00455 [Prevotella sp.]|nr:hypothetical protein [Prevotella sp.]
MQLPNDFILQMKDIIGDENSRRLCDALAEKATVSIRLNRAKTSDIPFDTDTVGKPVAWCNDGFYLKERPLFTLDPLLHAGAYYVQEASSMFLSHVVGTLLGKRTADDDIEKTDLAPLAILDMCAAPGGKSTILRTMMPQDSLLIANEPIGRRANILSENIQKQGFPNTIVTNNYPKDFSRSGIMFDFILCDVPCSGEGMFRKDHQAIEEWSPQSVAKCQALQREIVSEAWKCLRDGGTMIYSTCTFNTRENEENIRWIADELGGKVIDIPTEPSWNISGSLLKDFNMPVYRFIPGKTEGEGLFMAVIRKKDDTTIYSKANRNIKGKNRNNGKNGTVDLSRYIRRADDFTTIETDGDIVAFPKMWEQIYKTARKNLRIFHAGITIGQTKGRDFIPHQALALSTILKKDAFPCIDLEYEDAIKYLRKESIELHGDVPRGYVVVCYKGLPLGFVKNIGNRSNNLYPNEWRVRMTL